MGAVIRDNESEVLEVYTSNTPRFIDSFMVKTRVSVYALHFAHELGMRNIILEEDVLTVTKKLQIKEHDLSPIGNLISEAKLKAFIFSSCRFKHVKDQIMKLLTFYQSMRLRFLMNVSK